MSEYEKIQTVYKRDPATKYKTLLEGEFSRAEFELLKDIEWVATEKVDGTNIRVYYDGDGGDYTDDGGKGPLFYMGRTDRAQIPPHLKKKLNELLDPALFESEFGEKDVVLYGEGYGPKIQKGGGKYREDVSFVLFDVAINDVYLERSSVVDIAGKLGLDVVPVVERGSLLGLVDRAKEGIQSMWGDFEAEGFVMRPVVELQDRFGNRIITKIKCSDFPK